MHDMFVIKSVVFFIMLVWLLATTKVQSIWYCGVFLWEKGLVITVKTWTYLFVFS